jgi:predicted RNA-binding Zn ribbon-like protein
VADRTASPEALLLLANLGLPRRPSGAAAAQAEPILPDAKAATGQLAELVDRGPVGAADLPDLRRLQRAAADAAAAILAGQPPDTDVLNALAAGSRARVELSVRDGVARRRLTWIDSSLAGGLARRVIEELDALAPDRLRRCARPECDLLFYDTTRSRTRRWHAEDPCGWRERQRVHRSRHDSSA